MTELEALACIAERVMRWHLLAKGEIAPELAPPYFWVVNGEVYVYTQHGQCSKWHPDTDPSAALEMLGREADLEWEVKIEIWRGINEVKHYRVALLCERPERGNHEATGETFPAAAWAAVCAAENIEVKE